MTKEKTKKEADGIEIIEPEVKIDKKIKITASYLVTERETNVTSRQTYEGEGKDVAKALEKLNFPSTVNCLVQTKVESDKGTIEKALAPHKARQILGMKNIPAFNATYRGFV